MKKSFWGKVLVCGIILLFIGTSSIPSMETITKKNLRNSREELKIAPENREPQASEHTLLEEVKNQQTHQRDIAFFYAYEFDGPPGWISSDGYLAPSILPTFPSGTDIDIKGNWYAVDNAGGIYQIFYDGYQVLIASSIALNGLTYDPTTGIWYGCDATNLYTINITTGATTVVGPLEAPNLIIDIACNFAGEMYGYDVLWTGDSTLYSIDKNTGEATVIGSMGVGFLYAQDCCFDRDNNILYIAGRTQSGMLGWYICDVSTGAVTLVGSLVQALDALAFPYQTSNWTLYPHANFTWNPITPYPGDTVLFNASMSHDDDGYITLYEWDWNDDGVYEEAYDTPTAMHSWTFPGSYTVTLRVTDNTGFTGRKSKIVDVINQPPEKPIINGPVVGRVGVTYNFTVVTTDPEADQFYYLCDWGDGDSTGWLGPYDSGEYVTFSHAWDNVGTYLIQVKAKNPYGEEIISDPFAIQIVALKKSLIIGSFNHQSETDDLRIIDTNFLIIVPSDSIMYYRVSIVIAKNYRFGFLLSSHVGGIFEAALLS
jgi:PKD repeat protein